MASFVYLASASPRRKDLLKQMGVTTRPLLADKRENVEQLEEVRRGELPRDYVLRVAKLKLDAARRRLQARGLPPAPILVADTTVALGRRILGKPDGPDEARAMLGALSGRSHRVLTAVAVSAGVQSFVELSVTRVEFVPLSASMIDAYIDGGECFGKAGAYGIQGRAGTWARRVVGSHTGVMGLPVFETATLLRRAGLRI
ncbi:Maf family protein [Piscinibacter sakaiensis]|uniref:Maf family protein n=1 Tax=Piscinibacter sakaiensis TaxID=1547922 RepID=UPI0006B664CD|nr:Maf family protein [Piscinibacter sakaiensis]